MATILETKQAVVAEVAAIAAQSPVMVGLDLSGLTVSELTRLRREARRSDVYLKVVKNTLLRRAVMGTGFECVRETLKGPLLVAFSRDEPGAAARMMRDFRKANPKADVRLVAVAGRLLGPQDLDAVAKLPTRDEALAQLMGVMKAPIAKLVRVLAAPNSKLVRTLAAVRDQKQG
ncbi:MAG: 50S ribosomal protein L10 [Immundisolibacter sp.]|uniref:50S ribosomal protein L10 n=1 Tax=Immundisolibacter sp. TaxID=1934948 RepID=UPI003EE1F771